MKVTESLKSKLALVNEMYIQSSLLTLVKVGATFDAEHYTVVQDIFLRIWFPF